ncbi:MAG TPA: chromate transporter [Verrucomicrobiae bacterium]|nr:chromate transporter [Verrucomicrobiae bacterium]
MFKTLWDVFIAFTRASNLGFGGGPAVIPLIQQETVDRYQWMNNQEFTDSLAAANALPGPIATKMAAVIGYKAAGWLGAFVGLLGTILPTALAVILMSSLLMKYSQSPQLKGMLKAVRPVVVVLVAWTAWEMGRSSFPGAVTWIIAAIAVAAMAFKIHPIVLILAAMAFGYFYFA